MTIIHLDWPLGQHLIGVSETLTNIFFEITMYNHVLTHPYCSTEILVSIHQGLCIRGYLRLTPTLQFFTLT